MEEASREAREEHADSKEASQREDGSLEERIERHGERAEPAEKEYTEGDNPKVVGISKYRKSKQGEKPDGKGGKYTYESEKVKAKSSGNGNSGKSARHRTIDGAVAIIYHEDKDTGQVWFKFERKPDDYALPQYRGKLAFIGGAMDAEDRSSHEALGREIGEEVGDEKARLILWRALDGSRNVYRTTIEEVGRELSQTKFYDIKVQHPRSWDAVAKSPMSDDAGPSVVMSLEQVLKSLNNFAFDHGAVVHDFIRDNFHSQYWAAMHGYTATSASRSGAGHNSYGSPHTSHYSQNNLSYISKKAA